MSVTANTGISAESLPPVPLTVEGSSVLHQMFRIRWSDWKQAPEERRSAAIAEAAAALGAMEANESGQSGLFSLLGHKGDLMFIHFRESFEQLNEAEMNMARLNLSDYLEPTSSYLSMVELGLYESTARTYSALAERGVAPFSPEWDAAIQETLNRQRAAMKPRLYPEIPKTKYGCFYPMDRRRGETKNWYQLPMAERQRQMHEHGMIGRRYAGEVRQIISGSIGFDDWEWGVDLFADDPLVFKKLIYEMRFDEVSAVYAAFGSFYVGIRKTAEDLAELLKTEAR